MSDKIGHILLSAALAATLMLITVSSVKLIEDVLYRDKYQSGIEYYENYYRATETLLDSLGVECDDSIFKTKAGRDYSECKNKIDSIFYNSTDGAPFGIKEE